MNVDVPVRTRRPPSQPSDATPAQAASRYLSQTPAGSRGLNLGCGGATFSDLLNIDDQHPELVDIIWDLTRRLPFLPSDQFDVIYSEHFFEHIQRRAAIDLLRDCLRALRPGGTVRIAMPCLDSLVEKYRNGARFTDPMDDTGEFTDTNGPLLFTRGEWLNVAMRSWNHTYIYNYEDLELMLQAVGFTDICRVAHSQSRVGLLAGRETRSATESELIVEATKP
jgi:predicted SAM-dependent methyltransferase